MAILLSADNFADGVQPSIVYANPDGNAVDALEVCIRWTEHPDIAYRAVPKTGQSYTFSLTDSEFSALINACTGTSLKVKFTLRTTINGQYSYSTLERSFTVDNAHPLVSGAVVDTNSATIALTGNSGTLIKYFSNAKATMTATAQKGAAIDESLCIIRNGNRTGYGMEATFNNVENNTFTFSAEDSRGLVGTDTVKPTMINYIKLTCNIANNRPDASGDMRVFCSGNYFNGSFGAVYNTITVQYRYGLYGGAMGAWTDMTVETSGNTYTAYANLSGLDYQTTYSFETRAIDRLTTITSTESAVKSMPIFHWGENDFVFEVPVTFNAGTEGVEASEASGDFNVKGNLRLKGDGDFGNWLYFGDGNYVYLAEIADDVLTIRANTLHLNSTNGVYVNGSPISASESGTWTPAISSSAFNYYTYQEGWYTKVGNVVTVGFFVKASCKSGYTSTGITISGLPYTPSVSASGGGMCSGAYVSGGYTFQCFVAETTGIITTRVQACNNTSATNLTTSASGCYYPSGGGEITLSGTIQYLVS